MDTKPIYTEIFMVPFNLMGLAIGRDGANIKKSRQIQGVLYVRNELHPDGYRFTVIGESKKAVKEARFVLELKQKAYTVQQRLAGRVIGTNGNVIKEVIKNSLVKKIEIRNKRENAIVKFNIIGSTEAIQRAVRMLNNKLDAIECINKRIRRQRNESKADKKKLSSNDGEGNSFKGKYNEDRRQKQHKKGSCSKTPDEDCFVFFLKNKIFRRIDYDKKQKQKQRALQKLSRCNVKMQHQDQRNFTIRELPIDFQLLLDEIVHSDPPFIENIQCEEQHNCFKTESVKAKVKIYVIKTDQGPINLTKARFHDSCLGNYIETAIKKKGLNGALKVATWTDCDDEKGTWISLESAEFLNEKGEICFECMKNENKRRDEQQFFVPQQTKVKATVKNRTIETNHRKTKCRGKYFETAIKNKGSLQFGTSTDLYDDKGTCIHKASPRISNKKGKISFEKCTENESKIENEQFWLEHQETKDSWEEWDSDEDSSDYTELKEFK